MGERFIVERAVGWKTEGSTWGQSTFSAGPITDMLSLCSKSVGKRKTFGFLTVYEICDERAKFFEYHGGMCYYQLYTISSHKLIIISQIV